MATVAEMLSVAMQYLQANDWLRAEHLYAQIVAKDPTHYDAWFLLGAACHGQGKLAQAQANYQRAIALRPGHASAFYNLGLALEQEGKVEEAISRYGQALQLEPDNLAALNNLGNVLKFAGRLEEAIARYRHILRLKPDFAEVHANLGNALADQDKPDEAAASYRHALALRPSYAEAHYNLGVLFARSGKPEEAIASYRQALSFKPDYGEAHINLGNSLRVVGQLDEALASFRTALALQPDSASAHWNRSVVLLLRGDFERGWPEYEWRWVQHAFARRQFAQPLWDGSDLQGRTILLHAEQGLGDTLQFIRFVPLVKQRCGQIVLECQSQLLGLLTGFPGIDRLVMRGGQLPHLDVQAPLLSLPGIFRTSLTTIPTTVPYLHADAGLVGSWRRELGPLRGFKIGIAWQGSTTNPSDWHRSIALAQFAPLADVPGVQLISLQKGPGTEQLSKLGNRFTVLDLANRLDEASGPFMDTAAVMMNLDLVISSDTAVPHLAGALGVPVWVALSLAPDWRWLLERGDSPWYPTMRLFRQSQFGRWEDVFGRMAEELRALRLPPPPASSGQNESLQEQ